MPAKSYLGAMVAFGLALSPVASAQETAPQGEAAPPASERTAEEAAVNLLSLVSELDPNAELAANGATFTLNETSVQLVFDTGADRMRLVSVIGLAEALDKDQLYRLMQANFDSALDARYAIAQGLVWSTFIHPLTDLTDREFVSGILQTVSLVETYGTTFHSGGATFGGGDSNEELEKLLERLTPKANPI